MSEGSAALLSRHDSSQATRLESFGLGRTFTDWMFCPDLDTRRVKDWRGADDLASARFQPLPIRTAREVFPQAAHPASFVERVMGQFGYGDGFPASRPKPGSGWIS